MSLEIDKAKELCISVTARVVKMCEAETPITMRLCCVIRSEARVSQAIENGKPWCFMDYLTLEQFLEG